MHYCLHILVYMQPFTSIITRSKSDVIYAVQVKMLYCCKIAIRLEKYISMLLPMYEYIHISRHPQTNRKMKTSTYLKRLSTTAPASLQTSHHYSARRKFQSM